MNNLLAPLGSSQKADADPYTREVEVPFQKETRDVHDQSIGSRIARGRANSRLV